MHLFCNSAILLLYQYTGKAMNRHKKYEKTYAQGFFFFITALFVIVTN